MNRKSFWEAFASMLVILPLTLLIACENSPGGNQPPEIVPGKELRDRTNEQNKLISTVATAEAFRDPDGTIDKYSAIGLPAGLSINEMSGEINGKPTAIGDSEVSVTASDNLGSTVSSKFKWIITRPANNPPTIVPGSKLGNRTDVLNQQITFSTAQAFQDSDGTIVSYSASGLPTGLSIISTNGLIQGVPTALGTNQVTVTATDNSGDSVSCPFQWAIIGPNGGGGGGGGGGGNNGGVDAIDDMYNLLRGEDRVLDVLANDKPGASELVIISTSDEAHATIVDGGKKIKFIQGLYYGTGFQYTVRKSAPELRAADFTDTANVSINLVSSQQCWFWNDSNSMVSFGAGEYKNLITLQPGGQGGASVPETNSARMPTTIFASPSQPSMANQSYETSAAIDGPKIIRFVGDPPYGASSTGEKPHFIITNND